MKKLITLLLALLMLVSLLAGCADSDEGTTENTTVSEEQTNVLDNLNVPDKTYDGKEFMFLTRDAAEWTTVDI
ncbi:MAG: hypothetical protein J6R46_02750, partial [Clostridia bacterium]|nr:hypothetical protein [Clostridia bacterium]